MDTDTDTADEARLLEDMRILSGSDYLPKKQYIY
jgi:hypothetical protein